MRLLNQSFKKLSISLFLITSIWSVVFYFVLCEEIYDGIDDSLEDYKELISKRVHHDSFVLHKGSFDGGNYIINRTNKIRALSMEDVFRDTSVIVSSDEDAEPVRMLTSAFERDGKYYELKVISSTVEEDDLIELFVGFLVFFYVILLISIFIVNNVLLRKLWNPFYGYLEKLKSFRIDQNVDLPNIKTRTLEFEELNKACDELLKYAKNTYARQKQFIENAAHELQTPLAVIHSKLELLLDGNRLDTEDAAIIVDVFNKIRHLSQMNKSLLLLSKIQNKQLFNNQHVIFNNVVKQVIVQFQDFAEHKSITIQFEEPDQITVHFDPSLAEILVTNLIKNAIIHNHENGIVGLKIKNRKLSICNTSTDPKLSGQVFERFYKGTDFKKGTGLGLAIADAICKLYGLDITYVYSERHCFEIKFN